MQDQHSSRSAPKAEATCENEAAELLRQLWDAGALKDAIQHALDTYPRECCGFIRRSGVTRCENAQDTLRAQQPDAFPRDARSGFALSAEDHIRLYESAGTANPVLAVYHSHPDGSSSMSELDRQSMCFAGRPLLPGILHLVIACDAHRIRAAAIHALDRPPSAPRTSPCDPRIYSELWRWPAAMSRQESSAE